MTRSARFQIWHYTTATFERAPVFPDGCRDVLIVREKGVPERIVLTELDIRPRQVDLAAGTEITGYRLQPGAAVSPAVLEELTRDCGRVEEILGNELETSPAADEILLALVQPGARVETVAADLGISVRTLQRHFKELALPAPDYWRLLARARRAAGLLTSGLPLIEIAGLCGFSDQAHMTRAFRCWFSGTPAQLRRAPDLLELLSQPALGNWTGEQISTR